MTHVRLARVNRAAVLVTAAGAALGYPPDIQLFNAANHTLDLAVGSGAIA